MKKFFILTVSLICALSLVVSAMAATLSPALDIIAHSTEMTVSGASGETVVFTPAEFAQAAGVSDYESIRITSLPEASMGTLLYNDAAVCAGQVIAYDKIEKLSFQPADGTGSASFEFTFDGSYTMTCAIKLDGSTNKAPTAGPTPTQNTLVSTVCTGTMRASDADGDALTFEIVKHPETGKLSYDKAKGTFTYIPGKTAGGVSFEYRVSDGRGGISDISEVFINVSDDVPAISFADMDDSAYVAAAVTMADMGVMTYSDSGKELYFAPGEKMSRLEFLVSAMNAFGADKLPVVSSTEFDDDAEIPDKYKSYVYSAQKLGIVNGIEQNGKCCFMPDRDITFAEAAVILNNVIGHEAAGNVCDDTVPVWAQESVSAVYELGISDISVNSDLTRETAADMLYKLCSLIYE